MITYKATEDLHPFFSKGEELSEEQWLKRLNLSDGGFQMLKCKYFEEVGTDIIVFANKNFGMKGNVHLVITRMNNKLSDGEVKFLLQAIERILKPFNK